MTSCLRASAAALLIAACRTAPIPPPSASVSDPGATRALPVPPDLPGLTRRADGIEVIGAGAHLLLVAPKLAKGDVSFPVTLPAGEWFDVDSGERMEGGPVELSPPAGGSVRVFARAGAIVPEGPALDRAADVAAGPLTVDVWPGPDCRGELYLDAGEGFGYRLGALRRVHYSCSSTADRVSVTAASEGPYPTWWDETRLVVHGVRRPPAEVQAADGGVLAARYDAALHTATVTLPGDGAEFSVHLRSR